VPPAGWRLMTRPERSDSGPIPPIVLVVLSLTLLVMCYLISQAPQLTDSGIESHAAFGTEECTSYLGTPYNC
jgi:hypothetical protein